MAGTGFSAVASQVPKERRKLLHPQRNRVARKQVRGLSSGCSSARLACVQLGNAGFAWFGDFGFLDEVPVLAESRIE